MNFETQYKNIQFFISLEKEIYHDVSLLLGDKFNRLPNQTMLEIKKGSLASYNLIIRSTELDEEYCHYFSGILLTSREEDIHEELAEYLEQELILDAIVKIRKKYAINPGPDWRK